MEEKVYFDRKLAGVIKEEVSGEISFTYDQQYLNDENAQPISVSLPKQAEPYIEEGLLPFFNNLIPEGWLLTLAADQHKLNPYRDRFALLLATCKDTIGAVTIGPESQERKEEPKVWSDQSLDGKLDELSAKYDRCLYCYQKLNRPLEKLYHKKCSQELFGTDSPPILDFDEKKIQELGMRTINEKLAVPGVQKKISLSLHEGTNGRGGKSYRMTVANLWARYILKPRGHAPHLPENEHLALRMARAAGIKTANSGLLPLASGELAFISERFDRPRGTSLKYHAEDFCQILEKPPEKKYIGSIEQVAKALRKATSEFAPEDNILRLFELVSFSFIIGNADLHLKNLSILWSPTPSLAPAYDLLNTSIWIKDDDETALSIAGKRRELSMKTIETLYTHIGIKEKVAHNILKQMIKAVPEWMTLIDQSYLDSDSKIAFKDVINTRVKLLPIE